MNSLFDLLGTVLLTVPFFFPKFCTPRTFYDKEMTTFVTTKLLNSYSILTTSKFCVTDNFRNPNSLVRIHFFDKLL